MFDPAILISGAKQPELMLSKPSLDIGGSRAFRFGKRFFDIGVSLVLLLILAPTAVVVWLLNLIFNRGPLFFVQTRMGRDCQPFRTIKFRSMTHVAQIQRGHDDPIEVDRITPLGRIMRRCRIDELPQILNVLKGDMSLIGPRPDYFEHASVFLKTVPGYRERHVIRPGISGLAQLDVGYVAGSAATCDKVDADLYYIQNAGFGMEARLVLRTILAVTTFKGA